MWNDNDTHIDFIDVNYLVEAVKKIVENDNLIPCTVGVFGDWGSGKSSLMRMIENEYQDQSETLVIKFNGWLFEGYDDAKTALMTTIIEQIVSKRTLEDKAKKLAKKLFKQIDWLKLAKYGVAHGVAFATTGGIGNALIEMQRLASFSSDDIKDQAGNASEKLKDGNYDDVISKLSESKNESSSTLQMGIREFHSSFAALLKETKVKKLLVFIDDLDRCTPDTVISTLEAIKLFLFIENSAFIISADERLIKYAVRRRFPEIPGDASEVGRDYLEKLIQFPLRIPSLSESEMESYVNLLFTSIHIQDKSSFEDIRSKALNKKNENLFGSVFNSSTISEFVAGKISEELIEDLGLSAQIIPVLAPGLNGNPRQCKRFLNTLLMRFQMAKSKKVDLKKRVLAKLMLLEYFKPETFRRLSELQSIQEGRPKEVGDIERFLSVEDERGKKDSLKEDLSSLLGDEWINDWFKSNPKIASIDLRPYFFFSRDQLTTLGIEGNRMSSQAQEIYQQLISESKATNTLGVKGIGNLSPSDAASVFQAMANKIRETDTKNIRSEMIKTLCLITETKSELQSELISFFRTFPTSNLSLAVVPQFVKVSKKWNNPNAVTDILGKWSKAENNKGLAKAAEKELTK